MMLERNRIYNMDCVEWVAYIPEDKIEKLKKNLEENKANGMW